MRWRMAPGWWRLIGERHYDEMVDPEEELQELTDDDYDFSDEDPIVVHETVAKYVNDRMQLLMDYLRNYEDTGKKTPGESKPMTELEAMAERAKECQISRRLHKMVNTVGDWQKADKPFDFLVERFAEEITAGRIRYMVQLGYLPDDYSEIFIGIPIIDPDDPDFFVLTEEDFRLAHESRTKTSKASQNLPNITTF